MTLHVNAFQDITEDGVKADSRSHDNTIAEPKRRMHSPVTRCRGTKAIGMNLEIATYVRLRVILSISSSSRSISTATISGN